MSPISVSYSSDLRFRYYATFGAPGRSIAFIGLNPSPKDIAHGDPTYECYAGIMNLAGFKNMTICNLFPEILKSPLALEKSKDPHGERNMDHVATVVERCDITICCWGGFERFKDPTMFKNVANSFMSLCRSRYIATKLYYLGSHTKDGQPCSPIWMPKNRRVNLIPLSQPRNTSLNA